MTDTLRQFQDALRREERMLATQIAADGMGILLRVAINELDLDAYGNNGPIDEERSYLLRIGAMRLVRLALEAHPQFEAPTLTLQRNPRYSLPVLSLVSQLGVIEHGKRVAQSIAIGVGGIRSDENERYTIELPPSIADLELHERELERHYVDEGRRVFTEIWREVIDKKVGDDVVRLLRELVYPFANHFIGYDADPLLDFYFFGHAYNEMQHSKGYDTFHYLTKFGGQTFQNYKLAATFILSVAMKHRAFTRALIEKSPSTRLEDILTVSAETEGFLESMREFVNHFGARFPGHVSVTDGDVETLFGVLSVSRRNIGLLDRPGAPIPPLVQCSDQHVIKLLTGATSGITLFLLNSLQHSFPGDYDRAQQQREGVMQRAVKQMLEPCLTGLEFRDNIKLKRNGRHLTDIDLSIIEPSTGQVVLVQLKHQDPYGDDLAARRTRTARLDEQVSGWLVKVRNWLTTANSSELRATLRLPKYMPSPRVRLLILARHYAHSLRALAEGDDSDFANWNQLVTATARLKANQAAEHTLDALFLELRQLSAPEKEEYLPEPPSEWQVGRLTFSISQGAV